MTNGTGNLLDCEDSRYRWSESFVWRLPALLALGLLLSPLTAKAVQADETDIEADLKEGKRTFAIYCGRGLSLWLRRHQMW